jgi:hypothetical protein
MRTPQPEQPMAAESHTRSSHSRFTPA